MTRNKLLTSLILFMSLIACQTSTMQKKNADVYKLAISTFRNFKPQEQDNVITKLDCVYIDKEAPYFILKSLQNLQKSNDFVTLFVHNIDRDNPHASELLYHNVIPFYEKVTVKKRQKLGFQNFYIAHDQEAVEIAQVLKAMKLDADSYSAEHNYTPDQTFVQICLGLNQIHKKSRFIYAEIIGINSNQNVMQSFEEDFCCK